MNEPIDELITYADHTQGCMVGAGHDECTCGYDDAHAKMWAAWEALKAENKRYKYAWSAMRYNICESPQISASKRLIDLFFSWSEYIERPEDSPQAVLSDVPNSEPSQEDGR